MDEKKFEESLVKDLKEAMQALAPDREYILTVAIVVDAVEKQKNKVKTFHITNTNPTKTPFGIMRLLISGIVNTAQMISGMLSPLPPDQKPQAPKGERETSSMFG